MLDAVGQQDRILFADALSQEAPDNSAEKDTDPGADKGPGDGCRERNRLCAGVEFLGDD